MVVLLATDTFYPLHGYGAATILNFHVDALRRAEHQVIVLAKNRPGNEDPEFSAPSESVQVYRYSYPGEDGVSALARAIKGILRSYQLIRKEHRIDKLLLEQPLAAFALSLLPAGLRPGTFYSYLSSWYEEHLTRRDVSAGPSPERIRAWVRRLMEGWALRRSDEILVLSDFSRQNLLGLHPKVATPIQVMRGAVDTVRFRPCEQGKPAARRSLNLPEGQTLFLTVRNLVPRMGLDLLIDAMHIVSQQRRDWMLLIGGTGPLQNALSDQIAEKNLEAHVRLLGFIPDDQLVAHYQSADAFLLATRCLEGFGLVTVEALACGTPVLGTPVGATPEILAGLDPELLFTDCEASSMSRKVLHFLNHRETYPSPKVCREYAESAYGQQAVGRLLLERLCDTPIPSYACR